MSGFSNKTQSDRIYVNIVSGKLAVRAKSENELGATGKPPVSRIATNKKTGESKTVLEHQYDSLEGILKNISVFKHDTIGYQYILEVQVNLDECIISIPVESKYGDNFASKVPSIKAGVNTVFSPYDFEDKEKTNQYTNKPMKQIGITIRQNDEKIPAFFTAENPNGRPVPDGQMDEDDFKAHMIRVRKFYRGQVEKWQKDNKIENKEVVSIEEPIIEDDSLDPLSF